MRPINHVSVSIITGVVAYLSTKTISSGIACFLIGWLVDIDHIWDYYRNGCKGFSVKRFLDAADDGKIKKSYLYFHSYEVLAVLVIFCFVTHFNYLLSFIVVGFATHLFFDQIFNLSHPYAYFITFRMFHDYNAEIIFKQNRHVKLPIEREEIKETKE